MPRSAHPARGLLILLCLPDQVAEGLGLADEHELYSTNAICRQNYCINPIFPGLEALPQLEATVWQAQRVDVMRPYLRFCRNVVSYDPAVPSPNATVTLASVVKEQEKAAVMVYYYHLAGMNIEAADFKRPEESNDACLKSVWRMVCNTYFPRATLGSDVGAPSTYVRPCKNVCENYMQACNVKCCDESAKCVFEHAVSLAEGATNTTLQTGYVDAVGPSMMCTGGVGGRGAGGLPLSALLVGLLALVLPLDIPAAPPARVAGLGALLALAAISAQGCDVVGHATTAWEAKGSYLVGYQYVPIQGKSGAGAWQLPTSAAVLNSCEVANIPDTRKCSGHGICRKWNATTADPIPIHFCECDRDWADPECRTQRKSQATAYFLSLFTGYLGFDHFYLGEYYSGFAKLATVGGLGVWWVVDIVRIGSAPVYASDFRLASDLTHTAYAVSSAAVFAILGVLILPVLGQEYHNQRLKAKLLKKAEEDFFRSRSRTVEINPRDEAGMPLRTSYYVPVPLPDGGGGGGTRYGTLLVPDSVKAASLGNPFSAYTAYAGATAKLPGSGFQGSVG